MLAGIRHPPLPVEFSGSGLPTVNIPDRGHGCCLIPGGADDHALVVEQRRGQPVLEVLVTVVLATGASGRAGGFGHGQRLPRTLRDQAWVAFGLARVVTAVGAAGGV